ncbi:MAG TPA: addiction module protein [Pyrinomonadaceae bacterium]|nr:addiction module protein [Pyrinomonadaceae bacterium]
MSHELQFSPLPFELLSRAEQIDYVEANLDFIISEVMADESIPYWHREILADHFRRYREETEGAIPWEEVDKELEQELAKLSRA